ncbi:unnamed protein product [Prorocentrum cordatum]|uniref:Sel1 repeat family protein n=1 Tax=Prorocentrum cordatum TaxID=2364126 RepID=A0ABN9X309_9DINO|nr:unnamed protein product [Polarella glacialis]
MVRGGTISGDIADQWIKRIKDLDTVKKLREDAEKGNVLAMLGLADAYHHGKHGLAQDQDLATQWFRKAADNGDVTALDVLGCMSASPALKVHWWTCSAEGGGENACFHLAKAFAHGTCGLPKDPHLAKKWLAKMQGSKLRNADSGSRDNAAKLLRDLSGAQ